MKPTHSKLGKGSLLIATPEIEEGLFFRSVVLICENNLSGSFGLVINKMLDITLPTELLELMQVTPSNVRMMSGGPVQTNQMMILHTSKENPEQTLQLADGIYLGGDLPFLQNLLDSNDPKLQLSLYFGYAGWGAGQLEKEILDNQWFVSSCKKQTLFHTPIEKIWQSTLQSMGGKYASLSTIPEDLYLN